MCILENDTDRFNYRKILIQGKIIADIHPEEGPYNWISGNFYEYFYVPHTHIPKPSKITVADGIVKFQFATTDFN